jgi:uncharacterized membrane protein YgcG
MRFLVWVFILLGTISFAQHKDYERIVHYHSDIRVQTNSEVLIRETIKVYAAGNDIKRGIFRDLPLSYEYKGGNHHVGFKLLSVEKDGKPEPHHTEWLSNGIRIYAGDEDTFLDPGFYTYVILYRVDHVLGYFDDFDEIYWNVNGNGWDFQIDSISATVYLPKGAKMHRFDGYTGVFGSTEKEFSVQNDSTQITYAGTRMFSYGENLTVAVAWDKGHLVYPSSWDNVMYWCKTYALFLIAACGLIFGFIFNFLNWYRYGRDPKPGTIIPRFYAPVGFSPAECVFLKKGGRASDQMFGAQLVSLAVKGYVTIKMHGEKNKGSEPVYVITKRNVSDRKEQALDAEEAVFLHLMHKVEVLILRKKYNPKVKNAYSQLYETIDAKQNNRYFLRNDKLKAKQFFLPFLFLAIGGLAYYMFNGPIYITFIGLALHFILNAIYFRLYEQPTAEGRRLMDEIAGFEMYMKYADKLRIKAMNPPTMDFDYFEKNLAYAIALGVADEWKNQFDVKMLEEATVTRMPYLTGITVASMASFSSSMSSTISSASTPPSSSGSGSGGGGSSGGGGGGGGGGGW